MWSNTPVFGQTRAFSLSLFFNHPWEVYKFAVPAHLPGKCLFFLELYLRLLSPF